MPWQPVKRFDHASSKSNASIILDLTLTIAFSSLFTLLFFLPLLLLTLTYLRFLKSQISILISLCLRLLFLQSLSLFSPHFCMPSYFSYLKTNYVLSNVSFASLSRLINVPRQSSSHPINLHLIPSNPLPSPPLPSPPLPFPFN